MSEFGKLMIQDYVVVDLETTGLRPASDMIIEIAAVKVCGGEITDKFSTLVNPHRHITYEITALTGIDDSMVADAPDIDAAMADFLEFAGDMPLLGHNIIRFDMSFLKNYAQIGNFCVDTLYIAQHMKNHGTGCSLSALCSHFGIINDNAHRALSDCVATHEVYLRLKEEYRKNGAFFTMALACGKKLYQNNLEKHCFVGCELTADHSDSGELTFYSEQMPVGVVSTGKRKDYENNSGIVRKIILSSMEKNAKGKYLAAAEFYIKE